MLRRSSTWLAATGCGLAVVLCTTACGGSKGSGPSSAASGARLRSDARAALNAMAANAGVKLPPFTVTANAITDIACGRGKAKRAFSARQVRPWKGTPTAVDMHGLLSVGDSALENADRGYQQDTSVEQQTGPAVVSWPLVSHKSRTHVTLTARQETNDFTVTVTGQTDCVRKG